MNEETNTAISLDRLGDAERQQAPRAQRAWAEIDLTSLRHNLQQIQGILPQGCRIMAVVKADAYGHGAVRIASELQQMGVQDYAVATLQEGIQLRTAGIRGDILILGYTHPDCTPDLRHYHLTQTAVDSAHAEALNRRGQNVRVHLKIDTGMHRSGEYFGHMDAIVRMAQLPHLVVTGMYTHLSAADSGTSDDRAFTRRQITNFQGVVARLRAQGCCPADLHIQSSHGALNYPDIRDCTIARVGIALYGALSAEDAGVRVKPDLRPVLAVRAAVAIVREILPGETVGYGRQFQASSPMRIATVAIGYADGVPRSLTGGSVLIKGRKAPIIGRISMDQLTVDITGIPDVVRDDVATVIGQDGAGTIAVEQLARQCSTISNEILSRLGRRLGRIYGFRRPSGSEDRASNDVEIGRSGLAADMQV